MYEEKVVLCGASAYSEKYYLNDDFESLPESVKDELKIMCVLYTQDVGGILTLEFDKRGNLHFRTEAAMDDFFYDEIGSVLKIRELQRTKKDLLESLETYYRIFFLEEEDLDEEDLREEEDLDEEDLRKEEDLDGEDLWEEDSEEDE